MKRLLIILIALVLSVTMLASCDNFNFGGNNNQGGENSGNAQPDGGENDGENLPDNNGGENQPDEGEGEGDSNDNTPTTHRYTAFTPDEKALFNNIIGLVIPFVSNDEYYAEDYSYTYDDGTYEKGINFYTYGNTEEEFLAYKLLFADYTNDGTDVDEYGDTWYYYSKGDVYIDLSYYYYENEYVIDVYAYVYLEDSDGGDGGNGGNGGSDTDYTYTAFTSAEQKQFMDLFGFVIPFIPNDEYYVEEYEYPYDDGSHEEGLNFYAFGNTESEFNAYKAMFSSYTYDGTENDEYGDAWYYYSRGDVLVDLTYYYYEGSYVVDVYVYFLYEDGEGSGGTGSGSGNSGDDVDLITNAGAGLPQDEDGVYDVDFTTATNVKDVTDQGYYLDGCPTVGSPDVLIIPVQFSDVTAASKGYSLDTIKNGFEMGGEADYYSVYDYYFISSYGKLTLDIFVLEEWFTPQYASSYYKDAVDSEGYEIGDQMIMDEALAYLEPLMDLTQFDSDGNGIIDAIVMVNTLEIDTESNFNWAYRYWNYYVDEDGYYYEYDGVSANDYMWMSCGFFHEDYDEEGYASYDNFDVLNTYTAIHEFGHVLGADDYYDTSYSSDDGPMGGCDIMDYMMGDHCAYSKFNYGWLTTSRLVVAEQSVTLTLEKFSKNGDTIIIANNWDDTLGAYQEYYIVVYYTMDGLNGDGFGYFSRDGIVVYHVNASLYGWEYDGETYYDIYNNNTDVSDEYGTEDNLIEYVKSADDTFTYVVGDSLPTVTDDQGNTLCYTFTVDALTADSATLTFTKN